MGDVVAALAQIGVLYAAEVFADGVGAFFQRPFRVAAAGDHGFAGFFRYFRIVQHCAVKPYKCANFRRAGHSGGMRPQSVQVGAHLGQRGFKALHFGGDFGLRDAVARDFGFARIARMQSSDRGGGR